MTLPHPRNGSRTVPPFMDFKTPELGEILFPRARNIEGYRRGVEARPKAGLPPLSQLQEPGFALKPPIGAFEYSKSELDGFWTAETSFNHPFASLPAQLIPPPAATPTDGREYPQSPVWTLYRDDRWQSGYIYAANYDIAKRYPVDRYKMLHVDTPPGIAPIEVDGRFIPPEEGVAGMTRMPAGIPFVFFLDGDRTRPYTFGCSQTLDSLRMYKDWNEIVGKCVKIAKLTWGCKCHGIRPVTHLEGNKRNQRSAAQCNLPPHRKDGSYSLTNTGMQGVARGIGVPAAQGDLEESQCHVQLLVGDLREVYCLILPKCVSKYELAMMGYVETQNNVFTFGGFGLSGTSCQMNVSTLSNESLQKLLGFQGYWHPDPLDDPTMYTVLVLMLRCGPDGDPGPFCLGRGGIYCRETNSWIIFLVFKGNDMHSGYSPSEKREKHEEWVKRQEALAAWNLVGEENRVAYVIYMSEIITQRSSGLNVTPVQQFGNFTKASHLSSNRNFAEHGVPAFGGQDAWANRCAVEVLSRFWNDLCALNLNPSFTMRELLAQISYQDETTNETVALKPLRLDPVEDQEHIQLYSRYYAWYRKECHEMLIRVLRKPFKKDLADTLEGRRNKGSDMFADSVVYAGITDEKEDEEEVEFILEDSMDFDSLPVDKILGQETINGRTLLLVQLTSSHGGKPEILRIPKARLQGSKRIAELAAQSLSKKLPLPLPSQLHKITSPQMSRAPSTSSFRVVGNAEPDSPGLITSEHPPNESREQSSNRQDQGGADNCSTVQGQNSANETESKERGNEHEGDQDNQREGELDDERAGERDKDNEHEQDDERDDKKDKECGRRQDDERNGQQNKDCEHKQDDERGSKQDNSSGHTQENKQKRGQVKVQEREPDREQERKKDNESQKKSKKKGPEKDREAERVCNSGDGESQTVSLDSVQTAKTMLNPRKRKLDAVEDAEDEGGHHGDGSDTDDDSSDAGSMEDDQHKSKRARTARAPQEYEVSRIVGKKWSHDNDRIEYAVEWAVGGTSWQPKENLDGCSDAVNEFEAKNSAQDPNLVALEAMLDKGASHGSLDPATLEVVHSKVFEPQYALSSLSKLCDLLDADKINQDYDDLWDTMKLLPEKAIHRKAASLGFAKFHDWIEQNKNNFIMSTLASVSSKDSFDNHHFHLSWMVLNVQRLPGLTAEASLASVGKRLSFWEIARTLRHIYSWHVHHSLQMSSLIITAFEEAAKSRRDAYSELIEEFPAFGKLAAHILHYTFARHTQEKMKRNAQAQARKGGSRGKGRGTASHQLRPLEQGEVPRAFGPKPDDPAIVPSDLYGLVPGKSKGSVSLRNKDVISDTTSYRNIADVYSKAQSILVGVIREYFLTPSLAPLDKMFNSEDNRTRGSSGIWNRCVARGALLDVVAEVVGTDSIFATKGIVPLVVSPSWVYKQKLVFKKSPGSDAKFVAFITKDPVQNLRPLKTWMENWIDKTQSGSDIALAANALGDILSDFVADIVRGGSGSVEDGRKGVKRGATKKTFTSVAITDICGSPADGINIGVLGVIIREALNKKRGLPQTDERVRRVMDGDDPLMRQNTKSNPDQTNPFRHFNEATTLFKAHLAQHVDKPEWLSNALAWMGTGQGVKTRRFLNHVASTSFYRDTLDGHTLMFQTVLEENARMELKHKGRISEEDIAGWISTSDSRIWGQSSNHLKLLPTLYGRAMTLEEKLSQYWTPNIIDRWKEWCTRPSEQKTWLSALTFLCNLDVRGFQSGLTVFQLANNMTLLGLASMPSTYDIADWIFLNGDLGASHGLTCLGFTLKTCGATRCAFDAVYTHLSNHMTEEDKEMAGFSPIFVEHILCKVVRWDGRLGNNDSGTSILQTLAQTAVCEQREKGWIAGGNMKDPSSYPFPLEIDVSLLEAVVQSYLNNLHWQTTGAEDDGQATSN